MGWGLRLVVLLHDNCKLVVQISKRLNCLQNTWYRSETSKLASKQLSLQHAVRQSMLELHGESDCELSLHRIRGAPGRVAKESG